MRAAGVFVVLLLALASAADAQVRGRIMDLQTGSGIAGASVRMVAAGTDREVITGADGAYAITDLPPAEYWLIVRHPGYHDMSLRLVLRDGSELVLDVPLDIRPIPVSRLVVPVRSAATRPAALVGRARTARRPHRCRGAHRQRKLRHG
ncbi:MAG: carboxypeptidase-like regulatory domain-containing protein, partial [Longimicrobiales bacterium]